MGYKLSAMIADKRTQRTPPVIYLSTFGVWIGDSEVRTYDCPEGILGKVQGQFNNLEKTKKGQKKPMTLSWSPSSEHKKLFTNLKKVKMRITVFVEQYEGAAKWTFVFDDVEIIGDPIPETKIFKDKSKRTDERINATFMKFTDDPDKN